MKQQRHLRMVPKKKIIISAAVTYHWHPLPKLAVADEIAWGRWRRGAVLSVYADNYFKFVCELSGQCSLAFQVMGSEHLFVVNILGIDTID